MGSDGLGFRTRRAEASDSRSVADVWLRSRRAAVPSIPPPVHSDDEVRAWFATIVVPTRETWVIEDEVGVVALLVMEGDWVDQLYVDPVYFGRRLGSQLLGLAKEHHPGGLDLWTFQANAGARRFYERHGFSAIATTDGDNEEGAPDVRYHWPGG